MATKEDKPESTVPQSVSEAINAVAKGLGVAVGELWSIFVRQYIVRGASEALTAIVLVIASYFLWPHIGLWILAPLAVALFFFYGTIQLIGNPKYYAIEDIMGKIEKVTKKSPSEFKRPW